jgi:hypothetical protein
VGTEWHQSKESVECLAESDGTVESAAAVAEETVINAKKVIQHNLDIIQNK